MENNTSQDEVSAAKRGHVLTELLETERIYVSELCSILKGYKMEAFSDEMQPILPPGFIEKLDIIFGNLEEICAFHSNVFLKDLENCISSVDLVALCFVQRVIQSHLNPLRIKHFSKIFRETLFTNSTATTAKIYRDLNTSVRVWWTRLCSSRRVRGN